MSALVELARYQTRIEADLARLRLEAEGIEAVLFDAETNGIGLGSAMPVRLMVLDRERLRAAGLLRDAD